MIKTGVVVEDKRRDYSTSVHPPWETFPEKEEVMYKEVDVEAKIASFPLVPSSGRIYVVQQEVERTGGGLYVPETSVKDGEMQTNIGWVVAVADDVKACKLGDKLFYGRFSGSWVMDMKYKVMNEADILGVFK